MNICFVLGQTFKEAKVVFSRKKNFFRIGKKIKVFLAPVILATDKFCDNIQPFFIPDFS
jgi:hypothetical protein